jgi:hypothetical protein
MKQSLFDLIYHYIIAIDNDCSTLEQKYEILEQIKTYYSHKVPSHHPISRYVELGKNDLCERDILKEICDIILLNMEDENIFIKDYINSKQISNYYNYIYLPSLEMN